VVHVVVSEFVPAQVFRGLPAQVPCERLVVHAAVPTHDPPSEDAARGAARMSRADLRVVGDTADRALVERVEGARGEGQERFGGEVGGEVAVRDHHAVQVDELADRVAAAPLVQEQQRLVEVRKGLELGLVLALALLSVSVRERPGVLGPQGGPAYGATARPCRGGGADAAGQEVLQCVLDLLGRPEPRCDQLGDVEERPLLRGPVRPGPVRGAPQILAHQQRARPGVSDGQIPVVPLHPAQPFQHRPRRRRAHRSTPPGPGPLSGPPTRHSFVTFPSSSRSSRGSRRTPGHQLQVGLRRSALRP